MDVTLTLTKKGPRLLLGSRSQGWSYQDPLTTGHYRESKKEKNITSNMRCRVQSVGYGLHCKIQGLGFGYCRPQDEKR